jgi:hypothetical protein
VEKFRNWILDKFTLEYGAIKLALVQIEFLVTNYKLRDYYSIERGWNRGWNFKTPEEVTIIRKKKTNKRIKEANRKYQQKSIGKLNKQVQENL